MIVDICLRACALDIVLPQQHTHNHMKKHVKMARNVSDLTKSYMLFLFEGSKSDVWEYLHVVPLPQMENAQNLYPNFSFTIVIVFTGIQVSIKCRDNSKFHIAQL